MGSFYWEIIPLIGIYGKLNYTLSSAYSARFTVNTIKTTLYFSLMPAPTIIQPDNNYNKYGCVKK